MIGFYRRAFHITYERPSSLTDDAIQHIIARVRTWADQDEAYGWVLYDMQAAERVRP